MTVPTYSELYESIKADLRNKLGITTIVGKLVLLAFAAVQAAKLKIFYHLAEKIQENIFVDTCDDETLLRYGLVKLNRLPYIAVSAQYKVSVSGTTGAVIPSRTTFVSVDSSTNPGHVFILETEYTLPSTTGEIILVAEIGGTDSGLILGDVLQVTSPIANVDSFVTVISQEVAPVNDETMAEYRLKVINAYRTEPQGGAKVDYQLWAVDAAGVRRVYPYVVNNSPGDIEIFVESLYDDGVPDAAMLSEVELVIEQDPDDSKPVEERGRKPLGIYSMDIKSVVLKDVDITITGLTPSVQLATLTNAIKNHLYGIRPFIDGGDDLNTRNDKLYEADLYKIVRDLLQAGETFTTLNMSVDGVSVDVYTFENGNIPKLNTITV